MTEIINASDTSLKSALKQQEQQQPLKDVQCNNNEKISPSSSGASSPTMTPNSPKMVPQSKLIISNMESVIRSVKKQHVVKKKKRKIVEPEISDISNILTNSLTFISPNVSNSEEKSSLATVANGHDVQLIGIKMSFCNVFYFIKHFLKHFQTQKNAIRQVQAVAKKIIRHQHHLRLIVHYPLMNQIKMVRS